MASSCSGIPPLTTPSGYIAPLHSGYSPCKITISVLTGQTINITLIDYGTRALLGDASSAGIPHSVTSCEKYATIGDVTKGHNDVICSGVEPVRRVFSSKTNRVHVELYNNVKGETKYILYYEGKCILYVFRQKSKTFVTSHIFNKKKHLFIGFSSYRRKMYLIMMLVTIYHGGFSCNVLIKYEIETKTLEERRDKKSILVTH